MKDIKLFEKWVNNSIKDMLAFKKYEEFAVVCNGYMAFKIPNSNKKYMQVLKQTTFQSLEEDFCIRHKDFQLMSLDIPLDIFEAEKEVEPTCFYYKYHKKECKVFKLGKQSIYLDKNNLKYFDIDFYKIFGKSKVEPVLFKSNEIDIVVLPVRVDGLKWDVAEQEVKIVKGDK